MSLNPISALIKANRDLFSGRLHFLSQRIGENITTGDGQQYTIFRQAIVDPGEMSPETPGAVFQVWFHPKGLSGSANAVLSWLPLPFCVGCPGFRSKLWMVNQATGDCTGRYEWDTVQDAENYANSYAMRFTKGRSKPGTFQYTIERKD